MLHQPCLQLPTGCWGWKHRAVMALLALAFCPGPWLVSPPSTQPARHTAFAEGCFQGPTKRSRKREVKICPSTCVDFATCLWSTERPGTFPTTTFHYVLSPFILLVGFSQQTIPIWPWDRLPKPPAMPSCCCAWVRTPQLSRSQCRRAISKEKSHPRLHTYWTRAANLSEWKYSTLCHNKNQPSTCCPTDPSTASGN